MKELTLYLDDLTPGQIPLQRLAEYLHALARLYGHEDAVHFDSVNAGSARLLSLVEDDAYPKVISQVQEVSSGLGPKRALSGFERLCELMAEDKTGGSLRAGGAPILQFPIPKHEDSPLRLIKPSSVQGRLYSVGGKDETIPVRIEGADRETLHCEASIDVAERLGQYLFKTVRVSGDGQWEREPDGSWKLVKLKISSFVKLEDIGFKDAVARLKAAGGVNWNDISDAHSEILDSRG